MSFLFHLKGGSKVLIKVQRGIAFVLGMVILLTLTACQQNEPKEKDGKLLLTVCMESTSGLPGSAEKGTTMENSIREIARSFETEISLRGSGRTDRPTPGGNDGRKGAGYFHSAL